MALITAIAVIIGAIVILSILGIGADFFEDIQASLIEQQEQQNDQVPENIQDTGNFAKDTGTRVCNLRVDFVGTVTKTDIYGFNIFGDDIFVYMGDHGILAEALSGLRQDKNIINYQWFCVGDPQTLSWNFQKLQLFSLLDDLDGEIVRMKFEGFSKDTGKTLFDKTGNTVFQSKQILPTKQGGDVALNISIFLEDVTEDDYTIKFWSDDSFIGVNGASKEKGHKFSYDLCKPSLSNC